MERDKEHILNIISRLGNAWAKHPELRLGGFITMVMSGPSKFDLRFTMDARLMELLEGF